MSGNQGEGEKEYTQVQRIKSGLLAVFPNLEAYERSATQQPDRRKKADRAIPGLKCWGDLASSRPSSAQSQRGGFRVLRGHEAGSQSRFR